MAITNAYLDHMKNQIAELGGMVQFAVDYMNSSGLLEDGCFTFPDGTTVHATNKRGTGIKHNVFEDKLTLKVCGIHKAIGWGEAVTCTFPYDHPPGRHSWTVDL